MKFPVSVLIVSYFVPVSALTAETLAPGMTAFVGSETVPVMVPRSLWLNAD